MTSTASPRGSLYEAAGLDRGMPAEIGALLVEPRIHLEPISAPELTAGLGIGTGDTVSLGRWDGTGAWPELPRLHAEVSRRIPSLWRLRVDASLPAPAVDVRYEVVALNGRGDRLSHADRPAAEIGVRVEPLFPEVVLRDGETTVLEGGMVLRLRLDETRFAGSYGGTVTVTFHQL